MRQIPLAIGPAPLASFDNFLDGGSAANRAALAHLQSLRPQSLGAPVYLWGPSGSGKTHLLRALVAATQARGGRAVWFDEQVVPPWAAVEPGLLIVLDGCERFDAAQQHAAFTQFIDAATQGAQVAAAGRWPPVDLPLRDDLRTRLGWGLVFQIDPLPESDCRAALRREADRRGIFLSDDVMGYLLTRFARDLKHLMALLDRLDEFALAEQRAITVPLLKKMLDEEGTATA